MSNVGEETVMSDAIVSSTTPALSKQPFSVSGRNCCRCFTNHSGLRLYVCLKERSHIGILNDRIDEDKHVWYCPFAATMVSTEIWPQKGLICFTNVCDEHTYTGSGLLVRLADHFMYSVYSLSRLSADVYCKNAWSEWVRVDSIWALSIFAAPQRCWLEV